MDSVRVLIGIRPALLASLALFGCKNTNVVPIEVATVEVAPSQTTMLAGSVQLLEAVPRGAGGERLFGRPVIWSTDDASVATVSTIGEVAAHQAGPVVVSARVEGVTGTAQVTVLQGPEIEVSPSSVFFSVFLGGEILQPRTVSVRNVGGGQVEGLQRVIQYRSGGATGWLAQSTLNSTTAPATLTVRVDPQGLEEGSYTADIEVRSSNAVNSPQMVAVTMIVGEALPAIQLSETSTEFSIPRLFPNPVVAPPIQVTNGGGDQLFGLGLEVQYDQAGQAWLSASLDDDEAPTQLRLQASAGTLQAGEYSATVLVRSNAASNSPQAVRVTLTITP